MSRLLAIFAAFCICISSACRAELQELVFMPHWIPQGQFAGVYVAQDKGFFHDEGLKVTIRHMGLNSAETPLDYLTRGQVDITSMQLVQAVEARAAGAPLLNVMQLSQRSGLWCVAHRPIRTPQDLNHMKIGTWRSSHRAVCTMLAGMHGLNIHWVYGSRISSLFIYKAVDATLCFSYNEYIRLLLSTGSVARENVLRFSDFGYTAPEDGLYVTEETYAQRRDALERFARAVRRGWEYAHSHQAEALAISARYIRAGHVSSNKELERMMLDEYLRLLVNPRTGLRDFAPVTQEEFDKLVDDMVRARAIPRKVEYAEMIRP
ncbi:MAG: ABC transporter substrate-binding protein [Akkermansia sp.]|nr:ABC transporter substrate-binding protein [Akkermansia sp.]